jgi:hypothetical protein
MKRLSTTVFVVIMLVAAATPAAGIEDNEMLFTGDVVSARWEGVDGERFYMLHTFGRDGLLCAPTVENCKKKGSGSPDQLIEVTFLEIWGVDHDTGGPDWGSWHGTLSSGPVLASSPGSLVGYDAETGHFRGEQIELTGFDAAGGPLHGILSVHGTVSELCTGKGKRKECDVSFAGIHPTVVGSVELSSTVTAGFGFGGALFEERRSPVTVRPADG